MRIAGFAFAVLFAGGVLLFADLLGTFGDPDPAFDAYAAGRGNRARDIAGGYLLAASGVALILFSAQLDRALRPADDVAPASPALVFLSGGLAGLLIIIAAASLMTVSLAVSFGRAFDDTGQFASGASVLPQLGYVALCAFAVIPAAAMVVVSSLATLRSGRAPRWLSYAGFPLALLLLLGFAVLPLLLLPIWVAATSFSFDRQSAAS